MATFKALTAADTRTTKSILNQLIDFVEEDISGSATRQKYQVFVTGGKGPGITSSLFQTVFDQDYSLQTSNPILDMTVGLFTGSGIVASCSLGQDASGKELFPSQSVMMREKINIYKQHAQHLLGNANSQFTAPFTRSTTSATNSDKIDAALFINFRRLFVRDGIKRETFAMKFYTSASSATRDEDAALSVSGSQNLFKGTISGSTIYTDVGAASSIERSQTGGDVGNIVNASNTSDIVGLLFYQSGLAVLDLKKITSASQKMSGSIDAISNATTVNGAVIPAGKTVLGSTAGNSRAKFIPDFIVSASIDQIVDHIASVRFHSSSQTVMTFQNETVINSSLVFCRAGADEFNFSTNPTYVDSAGRIKVISDTNTSRTTEKPFTFITTVGLYDASQNLLAVAKLSRPIEKNDNKDLTFRVRLDF